MWPIWSAIRKLGDYKLSQVWYERALKADPNHVLTWQYYGLWQIGRATATRLNIISDRGDLRDGLRGVSVVGRRTRETARHWPGLLGPLQRRSELGARSGRPSRGFRP
jgi:hypothetical protein